MSKNTTTQELPPGDTEYKVTMTEDQYQDWLEHLTHPANIQDVKKPQAKKQAPNSPHPTIKPEAMMAWLIKLLSDEGDTVLDCFGGSFTTGKVAVELNRNFIGIDFNKEYCEYGARRISGEVYEEAGIEPQDNK